MSPSHRKLLFRPLAIVMTVAATGLTILLALLQIGSWVSVNAAWVLWVAIALLVIAILLLVARVAALNAELTGTQDGDDARQQKTEQASTTAVAPDAQIPAPEKAAQVSSGLGKVDQALAELLFGYASNRETLSGLGSFFPYAIPQERVRLMRELAELPMTRTAYDSGLEQQLTTLSKSAEIWVSKLLPLISMDGENYTTRLDRHVSEPAYKQHRAMTDELGEAGFSLHSKMMDYQRYFASLGL